MRSASQSNWRVAASGWLSSHREVYAPVVSVLGYAHCSVLRVRGVSTFDLVEVNPQQECLAKGHVFAAGQGDAADLSPTRTCFVRLPFGQSSRASLILATQIPRKAVCGCHRIVDRRCLCTISSRANSSVALNSSVSGPHRSTFEGQAPVLRGLQESIVYTEAAIHSTARSRRLTPQGTTLVPTLPVSLD